MINKTLLKAMSIMILLGIFIASCKKSDDPTPTPQANIKITNDDDFGAILTDGNGRTLYFFARDVIGGSQCNGTCLNAWPAFFEEELILGEGLDQDDFSVIDLGNGMSQTAYKGWPLYYFAQDDEPGDVNGDGASNIWFVAKPNYDIMIGRKVIEDVSISYLVDAHGRTLYRNTNDVDFSACNDQGCRTQWPVFYLEDVANIVVPSYISADDFVNIQRTDDTNQTAYDAGNHSLWYSAADVERGETSSIGGDWILMNPVPAQ